MNKKGTKIILQHLLSRSPHQVATRINMVANQLPCQVEKISDQAYLDSTLSTIYCDFLISNQYKLSNNKPMNLLKDLMFQQNPQLFLLNKPQKENCQLQKKLISTIKKLNQFKQLFIVYSETQQVLSQMTSEEAYSHKKYLMYIYKWILNQNGRIDSQFSHLCSELKKVVVLKLCEAHTKNEEQVQIKNQLARLQILAKARQCNLKGDSVQAKINYEIVYENLSFDENTRMEALQYLCKNSQEKGDESYLLGMMIKIREQKGQQRHMKYVQNILSQINKQTYGSFSIEKYPQ